MGKASAPKKKTTGSGKKDTAKWKVEPEEHDFPAAQDYLELVMKPEIAVRAVAGLQQAETMHRVARDLLRASRLPLLPPSNPEVANDLKKVKRGIQLSPVLLVRGDVSKERALTVADGYHRICASYDIDQDLDIPCRIVDLPTASR